MAPSPQLDLEALARVCPVCKGSGWVCVGHPDLPFMHSEDCVAEGAKCRCNPSAAMPPGLDIVAAVGDVNTVAVQRERRQD